MISQKFRCDNIFYSVIGNHAGESPRQIISRKQREVNDCGYGLWSAKIDAKSVEQVWKLEKDDEVIVLCRVKYDARDPVRYNDKPYRAQKMCGPEGEKQIPMGITTTFTKGANYQAYVVDEYIILDRPEMFDFSCYDTTLADNSTKSYVARFKCKQFQNAYGKRTRQNSGQSGKKEIGVVMKLKYPFVVNLK